MDRALPYDPVAAEIARSAGLPASCTNSLAELIRAAGGLPFGAEIAERIAPAASSSADPHMALANLARWAQRLGGAATVFRLFLDDPRLLDDIVALLAASQYLADILIRDPHYYDVLLDPRLRSADELYADLTRLTGAFSSPQARLDALRRARRREMLRIGWVDVTSSRKAASDSFAAVVRAISDLADALIRAAFDICVSPEAPPFAVIAMGKLGGRELNYSSDVDLLFVYDAPSPDDQTAFREANKLAERLVAALSKPTHEGYLFRCDVRLRPGGRAGHLARSLAAYLEYYDRWPEILDRQALIKARHVAGNADLGRRFIEATRPYVYQTVVPASFFAQVRANKEALERRTEGDDLISVKEGRGGIRDIEFAVQFLQMLFGGRMPHIRTGNTLNALSRLADAGLLSADAAEELRQAYVFLRTVEHRLQLLHDLPVRHLPSEGRELDALAKRCGFPSADSFLREYQRCAETVRNAFAEVFHAADHGSEAQPSRLRGLVLNLDTPSAADALLSALRDAGFDDPDRALQTLKRLTSSDAGTGQRWAVADVVEQLVAEAADSPGPADALAFVEALAERLGTTAFFRALSQALPASVRALCQIGGGTPLLAEVLIRRTELVDAALDPDFAAASVTRQDLLAEITARLSTARSRDDVAAALRRFRTRHFLRIGIADLLYAAPVDDVCRWLTDLADVVITAALGENTSGFAVLGLGRLGGCEMQYGSDLDMVYIAESPDAKYLQLAAKLTELLTMLTPEGRLYEVDLRLRPEGRSGRLSMSLDGALAYYRERAQVWEKQAMLKARFVAGEAHLAHAFLSSVAPLVYPDPFPDHYADEIRAMKLRIERERLKPHERDRDLKLGPGGLSDVEFLVQLLQMMHGAGHPELRTGSTLTALSRLAATGLLTGDEAEQLACAYRFCLRTRNALYLLGSGNANVIPESERDQHRLAKRLGYASPNGLLAEHRRLTSAAREIYERRFPA